MKGSVFLNSVYDSKNLHALIQKSGLTRDKISELTGVPPATLTSYLRENPATPNLKHLTKLADFFAVPLDFITGRCEKELAENVLNDYGHYFMALRRAPYEFYLDGRQQAKGTTYDATEGEVPWPYNLVGAVLGKEKERELMSEDQEAGVMEALGGLDIRQERFILAYYRDGLSLKQVATSNNVSPEWVRQVITKGIRNLRHPARAKYLVYGKNGVETMKENTTVKAELAEQEVELASLREKLGNKYSTLLSLRELIDECGKSVDKYIDAFDSTLSDLSDYGDSSNALYDMPVEKMELPLRICNCLKRANCNTLRDVMTIAELGELMKIDCMGRFSTETVLLKIKGLTGKDLFRANGISK